ncbi:non-ribosomal peptide synthetase, partial [Paenibacillus puerhi]|uniref:non-ribosomal peptide synthetase n=1 Tax=Paenibacillus puerhi TaxID=2692622 RepID=UPI00135BC589
MTSGLTNSPSKQPELLPLSQPQQRIWYMDIMYPGTCVSTVTATIRIHGSFDRHLWKQAVHHVIGRHAAFRIRLTTVDGMPKQYIEEHEIKDFELIDLSDQENPDQAALAWVKAHLRKPMPMLDTVLYEFVLLKLSDEEHWYNVKMHHIATDGISMNMILNQISDAYSSYMKGEEPGDAEAPSYLDFLTNEADYEASERYEKDQAYWRQKFESMPDQLGLKAYNPVTMSSEAVREAVTVDDDVYEGVKQFCAKHQLSLFTFFLAALYIYLHKATNEKDIPIGTLYANRTTKKEKDMLGMFVSTVATRVEVEPEAELLSFVQKVAKEQSSILRHQRYPYNKIIQDLRESQRSQDIQRLFGISIQYRALSFAGFGDSVMKVYSDFCGDTVNDFDIHMVEMVDENKLVMFLDYRIELFNATEITQIIEQFLAVAGQMIENPYQNIQQLSLLGDEERELILNVFNNTTVDYPREQAIATLFEEQAQRTPEQTAVICGDSRLTYRELNERSNRLARTLRALGVASEQPVAIMAERSIEMVVGILAILKAGGAYVPIDPDYPEERIRFLLEDSQAQVMLASDPSMIPADYDGSILDMKDERIYSGDGSNLELSSAPDALAYVIYTSGTTGKPKGVMVEHRSVVRLVKHTNYVKLDETTRILQTGAIVFDASTFEIWGALLNGGQLYLVSNDVILSAANLKQAIRQYAITTMWLTSPLFNQLSQQDSRMFSGMTTLLVGGDVLSRTHINRVLRDNPGLTIVNGYGPTENTTFSTTYPITVEQTGSVPIGRPIANSTAYVVDSSLRLQPVGAWGELLVGGDGVARGYLNRPELTTEKFIESPVRAGERCYRTGDWVRWLPDGTLEYKGRIDEQVKIRGYRIELGEVEAQLLKVEGVQEAVVIAREDENGQKYLCAYFMAESELSAGKVRSELSSELPGYMVPSYYVQLERIPLTANGKVDRRALPAPEGSVQAGAPYVEARSAVEQALVSVWQSVLGVRTIGVLDHFFELGGDSIKAIQVSSRLLQNGYKVEMRDMFKYPTVAELSGYVHPVTRMAEQGEVSGAVQLTPIQHWFLERQPVDPHHYNQAIMVCRESGFDESALRLTLDRLVLHHDALRIVYRQAEGGAIEGWNREPSEGEFYSLEVVDFRGNPEPAAAIEAKVNDIQGGLSLSEGPLVKLGLFRCDDGDHLLLVIHHMVVDGVSWRILLEDLSTGYEQALRGEAIRLPHKTDSFQLWADRLARYANEADRSSEREYWQHLRQAPIDPLPKDYATEGLDNPLISDSRLVTAGWSAEETEQLLRQAPRAYNTEVNDLLLAALGIALRKWTGNELALINLEGHGREDIIKDVDVTRTVGWFTSQYPVLLDLGAGTEVAEGIKRVKEGLRRIPGKGMGYGLLRYLTEDSSRTVSSIEPEVSFNYLGQFDQDLRNSELRFSPYSSGASVSGRMARRYALDLNGMITEGALRIDISYSATTYREETIEKLAGLLEASLREVIAHCANKEQPELTPSDVLMKGLSMEQLDELIERTRPMGELEDIYPLTPMQKGMLFHSLMEPHSGAYFEQATFELKGSFHVEKFRKSLELLVGRHPILRTNYYSGWHEQPLQIVYTQKPAGFGCEDLRGLDATARQSYIEAFVREDKARGFDLAHDLLMRVAVLQTRDDAYQFVWSFHHIIMDGWCLALVTSEVFQTYFALVEQRQPETAAVPTYGQYLEWLERQDTAQAADYWSRYVEGFEHQTSLPQERKADGYEADKLSFALGQELTGRIHRAAKQHQVTVNTWLQAAWGIVLQKYNNQEDVVFGSVVSGRPSDLPGVDRMLGLFINTIPVRIQGGAQESFADLLRKTQEQALASTAYETYPLYEIQALTEQKQNLVNHIIVFENYPVEQKLERMGERAEDSFSISQVSMSEQTNYHFNITVIPGDNIGIHFEYNARAYDPASIEQIRGHLIRVLEQAADNPEIRIGELELVTSEEKLLILDHFVGPAVPQLSMPEDLFLAQFHKHALTAPEHPAVIFRDAQLSYRELNEQSNSLARTLQAKGIRKESVVAILADRSTDLLVAVLAVWKAGGAYVPIDPDYPADRISFMLQDSGSSVLLTQTHLLERVRQLSAECELGSVLSLDDAASFDKDTSDVPLGHEPGDLAYVIYTSGTTGRPKGVMIEHGSFANTAEAYRREYRLDQEPVRVLQLASFSFDVFVGDIARALYNGGTMVICPKEDRIDPERLYGWLEHSRITVLESTPALIVPFMQHVWEHDLRLSSLRLLITSSDSCSVTDYRTLQERFGSQFRIMNAYGVTEAAIDSSFYDEPLAQLPETGNVPIGQAWLNARFYIVDASLKPVPVGVPGELCIGGPGVARGYLNRPDLTAEKFVPNPYVEGERLYRTGDLARWMKDGNVDFIGRIDNQVQLRGYRIELGEIETTMQRFAGVRQAVVIDRKDERGHIYLCGYAAADESLDLAKLQAYLEQTLPSHMVPSRLMRLDRMPLTPNGKLDRKALPVPEHTGTSDQAYAAPRTEAEHILASVWQAVLDVEKVGIQDNFFALGGDSIKALQVSSRLLQAGYKLVMKDLFDYPTIAALSPLLQASARLASQETVIGVVELTPIQRWFFEQNPADLHHSNQSVMLYRRAGFEETALRLAMKKIAEHHDALRTVFRPSEQGYTAWNRGMDEGEPFSLDVFDLTAEKEPADRIESIASSIQAGIDLQEGPLMKLGLFRCEEGDHLLIVVHHLVVDGVSWRILFEDLAAAYEQALNGQPVRLPQKTDSFQTWAQQLVHYTSRPEAEQESMYWREIEQAGHAKLPKDYEGGRALLKDSDVVTVSWTPEETGQLLKEAHRAYRTDINDLLLAALGTAVHAWSGLETVLVNLEGHGREDIVPDVDITRTVGWFTSQFPVLLSLREDEPLAQRIKSVKESLRRIPNKGIGYGLFRYMSDGEKSSSLASEPEINFNYLGQFDQDYKSSGLEPSPYSTGGDVSGRAAMDFALDLNGVVADGSLAFTIRYGTTQYRRETVERLGSLLHASLQDILAHCVSKEQSELTPSDVKLAGVTTDELERLIGQTRALGELENVYALSPMQKGMLFHSLMDPKLGAYFEQATFDLKGSFDVAAFKQSLDSLVQRHEALRTNVYGQWKDEPVQVVFRSRKGVLLYEDLRERAWSEQERQDYAEAYALQDKEKGFDLERESLMRVSVLRLSDDHYRFVWSFHHMIMDGWCMSLVTKEVFDNYFALVAQGKHQLLEPVPYSKFIDWLGKQREEDAAAYWKSYLHDFEQHTVLPAGGAAGSAGTVVGYESARMEFGLGEQLTREIEQTAKLHQVTVNTLIQAVWGVILQRYNHHDDVVFGGVVSGRPAEIPGVESIVGLFINTIPVRVRAESGDTLASLMRRLQEQALESRIYETYPLYEIQGLSGQKQALFSHILAFENYPVEQEVEQVGQDGDHRFAISNVQTTEQTNYDFNLIVMPGKEILVRISYNGLAFEEADIVRIKGHFQYAIEQCTANPLLAVDDLELVTEEERDQLVRQFNPLVSDYPREKTLHELFEEQAERMPEQPAVVFDGAGLTYRELNERANRLARTLRAQGVDTEDFVGLMTERSPEMIVGILAILKAGAAYVPIDPEYPEERISLLLEDSGAKLLLVQEHLQAKVSYSGQRLLLDAESSYAEDGSNLEVQAVSEQLAYVIYTSGTTGTPKGNLTTHRNIVRVVRDTNYIEIGSSDIVLQLSSYAFDGSTFDIFGALLNGAKLVLVSKETFLDMEKLAVLIEQERISVMFITTALFNVLVDVKAGALSTVRKVLFGGERASVPHVRRALRELGPGKLVNVYGPTETTVFATYQPVDELEEHAAGLPIGRPISHTAAYIVGAGGKLNPIGVPGELWLSGDGVARGYLNRPEATAEKFMDNPFAPGERMYRTGDLARWLPDGRIEFMGRIDDQVKIRGYRIELGEVETRLLKLDGVEEAIVLAREDDSGQKHLCAYYVSDKDLGASELRRLLGQELPGYMVPSYFVCLQELPLTVNGKVDRRALPAPEGELHTGSEYAAPRTAAEHALASVWQSVLGAKRVGIRDNFFELGGDSIKSIQVSSRLLQAGYRVQMKDMFQYPTIEELSPHLTAASRTAYQGEVQGAQELTPIMHWFFEQQQAEPHHFNQAVMLYREQGFEERALRQTVKKLAEHHDILRLVIRTDAGQAEASIRSASEGELYTLDVHDFTAESDCLLAIEREANSIQSGMSLETGPLLKLGLFRCADGDHLLIAIHHLAVDGVSWRILFEDLSEGYEQALKGQSIRLPHKTDSFQTWGTELQTYALGAGLASERDYWKRIEAIRFEELPRDHDPSGEPTLELSETVQVTWTSEETEQLLKHANRAYTTEVNDLLLTALGLAVQRWSGLENLLVNLEGHGREPIVEGVDITRTVGWFTSQFPVVLDMGAEKSIAEHITTVKEGLRQIPNKGIGYGILKYLAPGSKEEFVAEPQISFNYLGQFDQDLERSGMRFSSYPIGDAVSPQTILKYALDVSGMVAGSELELTIRYQGTAYKRETIEKLASLLQASLREVIQHCVVQEQIKLTPSDVLLKGLTMEQLERIAEQTRFNGKLENVYALTPLQKGMLFHSLMEPNSSSYFEQMTFQLDGELQIEAFKQSLDLLIRRHHILRTNFLVGFGDQPVQVVSEGREADFTYKDLRHLEPSAREAEAAAYMKKDKEQGFDLSHGALMRVAVLQTDDRSYRFVWSFHHILMDGWCLSLMTGEVFQSYLDLRKNKQPELSPVTPYSQYIEWLERQSKEEAQAYWSAYLDGYEQQTLLPGAAAKGKFDAYAPSKLIGLLSKELTDGISLAAKRYQVTLHTLMQTAWGLVLQHYNNSTDVVFGSVVSGRPADIPGVESIIGLFINTIPVRVQNGLDESFAEVMTRHQEQALLSHAYDTYPLFDIQSLTEQKQSLISHIMVFENYPVEQQVEQLGAEGDDGVFTIANASLSEQTNYDFNLIVLPGEQLRIDFEYNAHVFDLEIMEQMQGHFLRILEPIAAKPDVLIRELELITPQEKELILHGFNDTAADYPREKTIYGLFEEQAQRTPEQIAVRFEDEQLTYRELNERANRLARTLRAEGVKPGDMVAVLTERSLEMLVGIYAILKAGGAYVPIDPDYPEERIRFIAEDSGARLLLGQERLLSRVPADLELSGLKRLSLNDAAVYDADGSDLEPAAGPQDVAYVIYTSGSTGKPKGVMIEHHSVLNRILWMHERYPIGASDVILQKTAFTFDVSVWELFWWAMVGASVCLLTPGGEKSPERIRETIRRYGVTTMHFVPAMLHAFLEDAEQQPERLLAEQLGTLSHVFASGEALPPQHVARFQQTVAWINRCRLINLYGPTEATVDVSYFD